MDAHVVFPGFTLTKLLRRLEVAKSALFSRPRTRTPIRSGARATRSRQHAVSRTGRRRIVPRVLQPEELASSHALPMARASKRAEMRGRIEHQLEGRSHSLAQEQNGFNLLLDIGLPQPCILKAL